LPFRIEPRQRRKSLCFFSSFRASPPLEPDKNVTDRPALSPNAADRLDPAVWRTAGVAAIGSFMS
jgi:hypothetical protein